MTWEERGGRLKAVTDDTGGFTIEGAPVGQAFLTAITNDGSESNRLPVTIAEEDETEVELVIQETTTLRGEVVSPYGGTPAAIVMAIPLLTEIGLGVSVPRTFTRPDGAFELQVPARAVGAILFVRPNGLTGRLIRVGPDLNIPVRVDVDSSGGSIKILAETGPAGLMLLNEEGHLPLGALRPWTRMSLIEDAGFSSELPLMAPGYYQVCWLSIPPFAPIVPQLANSVCAGGFLAPGGELVLEVPSPRSEKTSEETPAQ